MTRRRRPLTRAVRDGLAIVDAIVTTRLQVATDADLNARDWAAVDAAMVWLRQFKAPPTKKKRRRPKEDR